MGSPENFHQLIVLEEPFLYDPAQGNLLMDVRVTADFYVDSLDPFAMDASNVFGDSVSAVSGSDSSSGSLYTIGLVTALVVTPVPEPGVVTLFIVSLPVVYFARRLGLLRRRT